jgi:hypothetical protein
MKPLTVYEGSYTFSDNDFNFGIFQSTLNYPKSSFLPEPIRDFLTETLLPSVSDYPAVYQYCLSPINERIAEKRSLKIASDTFLSGPIIYRLLRNSDRIILLLATIRRKQHYEDWEDYIAYSFYNTLLHQILERIRTEILGILCIHDLQMTQRYAPGYCGWPITDQKALLSLLHPEKIGVKLGDSFMLEPTHTITGLYGIRQKKGIKEKMPCYTCTSVSCKVHYDFQKEFNSLTGIAHEL